MRIALFGAPGVGKGSQASFLSTNKGLVQISTGVILRNAIRSGSAVGLEAKKYMDASQLVPGKVVRVLAEEAIRDQKFDQFVLDGYPRTIEQAEWLSMFLSENDAELDCVVNLVVPDDVIVGRLSQRRVNIETGENFHLEFKPPPADINPELIIQRKDDKPEAILRRLEVYKEETHPLVDYYTDKNMMVEVDGVGSFEDIHARILSTVYNFASTD
jgi:adenylate kinase